MWPWFCFDGSTEHCLHSKHHGVYISSQVAKQSSTVSHMLRELHYHPPHLELEVTFFFFFLHALLFWHFIFKSSQGTSWQKNLGGSLLISLWGQSLEKQDILPSTGSRAPLLQQRATQKFPDSSTKLCFACTLGQISCDLSGLGTSNRHPSNLSQPYPN